jgi:indole-3-glycerol phosphate synthase
VTAGTAAPDILLRIAERRRERLAEYRAGHPGAAAAAPPSTSAAAAARARPGSSAASASPRMAPLTASDNRFLAALAHSGRAASAGVHGAPGRPAIIAEVKMGSPRLGSLHGRIDPRRQARIYADHGAAALSVVVEPDFFHGGYELLADCCAASGLPAVAKDFVVDPLQLVWARQAGADAVLLVAALYEAEELVRYAGLARGLGLAPLIETHDAADLALLAGERWELVGINNRDLRTFHVDLERAIALLPSLPSGALKVAESGIRDALDVVLLADSGFDALLIGEALLLAEDPAAKLRSLLGGRAAADAADAAEAGEAED